MARGRGSGRQFQEEGALEQIVVASLISALLVSACLYVHYIALRLFAVTISRMHTDVRRPMLYVLAGVFAAHLVEVLLFALAFYLMHWSSWLGALEGLGEGGADRFVNYFYFSITTFTTLGVGDIIPTGAVRIVAGIEALMGLMLIAWSASFSYLMMEKLWSGGEEAK